MVHYHALREIKAIGGDAVQVDGRMHVEVTCPEEHFSISVKGEIFGPELDELKEHFGSLEAVRVYVLVSEDSRSRTRGLYWLQKDSFGSLDAMGKYESRAYLGGIKRDRAGDRELFSIRVYIPDKDFKFKEHTAYTIKQLSKPLFLSDSFYITTRRTTERDTY